MADVIASRASLPAGGGPFALDSLTLGVFLTDQPGHRLALGSDRGTHLPLRAEQGWILPAGAEGLCSFDAPLDFVSVRIPAAMIAEAAGAPLAEFRPIAGDLDPVLRSLAIAADGFATGGTLYRETMERALAAQLVQVLAPPRPWQEGITDARLRRVLDFIHEALGEDLSLTAMAGLAAMSPAHFSRAFKAATGASPLQYVIGARLERAAVLLRTTALPVAEIAHRVGYHDLSRFGQHFKRRHGVTPARLRAG